MYTITNTLEAELTVGDLRFPKGGRHFVSSINHDILTALGKGQISSNPPIAIGGAAIVDNSGGSVTEEIEEITEVANAGSSDAGPTADAIATLTSQINSLKAAIIAAM